LKIGAKRRSVNYTAMNKNSSRSHAVLQVLVEQRWVENGGEEEPVNGGNRKGSQSQRAGSKLNQSSGGHVKTRHHRKALLTIVDLAGSERLSKTGSEGMRLKEA
jgi:Kinesin motor domain